MSIELFCFVAVLLLHEAMASTAADKAETLVLGLDMHFPKKCVQEDCTVDFMEISSKVVTCLLMTGVIGCRNSNVTVDFGNILRWQNTWYHGLYP